MFGEDTNKLAEGGRRHGSYPSVKWNDRGVGIAMPESIEMHEITKLKIKLKSLNVWF